MRGNDRQMSYCINARAHLLSYFCVCVSVCLCVCVSVCVCVCVCQRLRDALQSLRTGGTSDNFEVRTSVCARACARVCVISLSLSVAWLCMLVAAFMQNAVRVHLSFQRHRRSDRNWRWSARA